MGRFHVIYFMHTETLRTNMHRFDIHMNLLIYDSLHICTHTVTMVPPYSLADFHRTAPYVVTGSVDQTVKIWECR